MRSRPISAILTAIIIMAAGVFQSHSYAVSQEGDRKDQINNENNQDNPWVLKKDKEGIKVFVRNVPGIDFKEFMGITVFNVSIEKLEVIMNDIPNQVNWMCDTVESKLLNTDLSKPIIYYVVSAPIVAKRDVVVQVRIDRSSRKIMWNYNSITYEPVPNKKGIVRMPQMVGLWMLESTGKNQTRVTYRNLADPGGSIPTGLVNMTVVKQPFITLLNLRKQLDKPKYL
jgi:hypothetical protein